MEFDHYATWLAHWSAWRSGRRLSGAQHQIEFASRWVGRSGEWADRLNGMPKYVVSSTLTEAKWSNSTVLSNDLVEEVSKLKKDVDGDINQLGIDPAVNYFELNLAGNALSIPDPAKLATTTPPSSSQELANAPTFSGPFASVPSIRR